MAAVAARCPGGKLPDNYLVLDFETTGFSPTASRVLSIGYAAVRSRAVANQPVEHLVKHAEEVENPPGAFAVNKITRQMMLDKGVPHKDLFGLLVEMLMSMRAGRGMVMGHNFAAFDAEFLINEARRAGIMFQFLPNEILDTGILVKAHQLHESIAPGEDLRQFYARISNISSRVKWGLDYCYVPFGLDKLLPPRGQAHGAGDDCLRTHYVFERLRCMSEVTEGMECRR